MLYIYLFTVHFYICANIMESANSVQCISITPFLSSKSQDVVHLSDGKAQDLSRVSHKLTSSNQS